MILYHSSRWVIVVADIVVDVLLGHLNEYDVGDTVLYPEPSKLESRPVVTELAKKPVRRLRQCLHISCIAALALRMLLRRLFLLFGLLV